TLVPLMVSMATFRSPPAREAVILACQLLYMALTSFVVTVPFVFIPAVVLFEGLSGIPALMRGLALLRANWRRAFLVLAMLTGILGLAEILFGFVLLLLSFSVAVFWAITHDVMFLLMPSPVVRERLYYIVINA